MTVVPVSALARTPLFEGLDANALAEIASLMTASEVAARGAICRAGEPGGSLFVIADGLAYVTLRGGAGGERTVAKLRRGDLIGEMSLVTGEPRTATVVAGVPTTVLELTQSAFAPLVARHPALLANLNRVLTRKLAETTARVGDARSRGEAVALIVAESGEELAADVVAATEAASARPVAVLDARTSLQETLAAIDQKVDEHGTVLLLAGVDEHAVPLVLDHVDRAVALVTDRDDVRRLVAFSERSAAKDQRIELVVAPAQAENALASSERIPVVRVLRPESDSADVGWVGRHLARTKLGLALGAGGAKGYAHVGVLYVLEEAGYTVDYVSGSSIGALVGAWLALGRNASEVETTMRRAFTRESADEIFKLSLAGGGGGLDALIEAMRESTDEKSFDDLVIPLVVMTVDLATRQPLPMTEGPLWEALVAATALAGVFPPYERDGQRLVDGLALVPVPTGSVVEAGADVTVSVNIMPRDNLPAWPGKELPPSPPEREGRRSRMLDALFEVMDLAQFDASERHAALADVTVTPRFGPCHWRDFHLAELFLGAGREAAEEQLPLLASLARPQRGR